MLAALPTMGMGLFENTIFFFTIATMSHLGDPSPLLSPCTTAPLEFGGAAAFCITASALGKDTISPSKWWCPTTRVGLLCRIGMEFSHLLHCHRNIFIWLLTDPSSNWNLPTSCPSLSLLSLHSTPREPCNSIRTTSSLPNFANWGGRGKVDAGEIVMGINILVVHDRRVSLCTPTRNPGININLTTDHQLGLALVRRSRDGTGSGPGTSLLFR